MITLFGSLIGFLGAIFPEFLKLFRDHQDKKHELRLLEMQMEQQRLGHAQRLEEVAIGADIAESQALYKTYHAGVAWVDALNGSVRPVLAYAFFFLYAATKIMQYSLLDADSAMTLAILWNVEDQAIFAGIMSFYFGQRAMAKLRR